MASPLAATRTAVRGIERGVRGAQAVGEGVMEGARRAAPTARKMLQDMPAGLSVRPTGSFTPTPTPEAPFVGRLDQFAASMPGPMKKDQLLGTLKGKFKDYELERARIALGDLPADAKVMPTDFLNRLNNVNNPAGYRTTVLEPQQGSYYQTIVDNPFSDGANTPPMGVIHLTQFVSPAARAAMTETQKATSAIYDLSRAQYKPEQMKSLLEWAKKQPDGVHITNLLTEGPVKAATTRLANIDQLDDISLRLINPDIHPEVKAFTNIITERVNRGDLPADMYAKLGRDMDLLTKSVYEEGRRRAQELGFAARLPVPPQGVSANQFHKFPDYTEAVTDAFKSTKEALRNAAHNDLYPVHGDLTRLHERLSAQGPYMGQHPSALQNPPLPISFSRFTEQEAVIPGRGNVKGIYVHELQSDLLDDLRKRGTKGGGTDKDYRELAQVEEKLRSRAGMPDSEAFSLLGRRKILTDRLDNDPLREPVTYSIEEALPGMEKSPQVVQQLMVKNSVNAAVQRGAQFVAFPGKESSQAQLYEKLEPNLKAVIKELGPGFEYRTIDLPLPEGKTGSFRAITWGSEAAERLQKQGIPFSKGGMVERKTDDNRSYK
jgi:hypothetical protein